jgi:hypothetical protein
MTTNFRLHIVTLEYNNSTYTITVEPYKKLSYIKQQAQNHFYPLGEEIKLIKNNKDLTKYENNLIGDIFRNQNRVHIHIEPMSNQLINQITPKSKKRLIIDSYEHQSKTSNQNPTSPADLLLVNPLTKSTKQSTKIYICSCKCGTINYLCRNCNEYICNSCRQNKIHVKHSVICIDTKNFEESAKLYAITVQNEINAKQNYILSTYENNKNSNYTNIIERYNQVIRKLQEIQEVYQEMIDIIMLTHEKMNKMNELVVNYKDNCKEAEKGIDCILNEVYKNKKQKKSVMDFEKFKSVCNKIKDNEDKLKQSSIDILAYGVNYEVNKQMFVLYNKLDTIIENTLHADIPLNLQNNTYMIYDYIKKYRMKEIELRENLKSDDTNEQNKENITNENKDEHNNKDIDNEIHSEQNSILQNLKELDEHQNE